MQVEMTERQAQTIVNLVEWWQRFAGDPPLQQCEIEDYQAVINSIDDVFPDLTHRWRDQD